MPLNGWVEWVEANENVYFMESEFAVVVKNASQVTVHLDQDLKPCTQTGGDPMVTLQPGESWTMQKPQYVAQSNVTSLPPPMEPAIAYDFDSLGVGDICPKCGRELLAGDWRYCPHTKKKQKPQLDIEVATDGAREINLEDL